MSAATSSEEFQAAESGGAAPRARLGLRLAALALAGVCLLLSPRPSAADDRATCQQRGGDAAAAIAACGRALDGWFVTDVDRRALRIARARHFADQGRGDEAVRELRDVVNQLRRLIARMEQDAHDCLFKWNCRSTADGVSLDAAKSEYGSVTAMLQRTEQGGSAALAATSSGPSAADPSPQFVRRLQAALAALGHAVGRPDGKIGPRTRRAIAAYQRGAGLPAATPLDESFLAGLETAAAAVQPTEPLPTIERTEAPPAEPALPAQIAASPPPVEPQPVAPEPEPEPVVPAPPSLAPPAEPEILPPAIVEPMPGATVAIAAAEALPAPLATPPKPAIPETSGGSRIALVIGNGAYRHAPALPNPGNDASDVTALLRRMHFTVMQGTDLERDAMEDLMIRFAKAASNADIALAFYAGHGIQVEGTNYLVPVDATVEDELDLRRLIRLDDMVRDTGRADRFGLVMVDACRDNPFESSLARSMRTASRSLGPTRGLAAPVVPPRVLVAYATGATETAADGTGRNSPFTSAMLKHLAEPDDVRIVIGKIVDAVAEASDQRQRPDYWGSLGGDRIFLVNPEAVAEALDVQLTAAERQAVQRSLSRMGLYAGAVDGSFTPAVRRGIRDFQIRAGAAATGYLTVDQLLALYEAARYRSEPGPLPQIDIIELLRRSEAGERDAAFLRAKLFDRAYMPGPLPKDMAEAARWYQRAAEAGEAEAALALARILRDGDGVEPDPAGAVRWMALAAESGSPEAQYELAQLYADGNGVPADQAEAIRLYRLAAASQSGEAITRLRALQAWDAP